ncbi:hypothetical protein KR222_001842, partial [Zaprionus bogoriensis]
CRRLTVMAASGSAFRFTDARNLTFVELYGREPCLWNRRPYLWGARNAAYKRIQQGINCTAEAGESPITLPAVKTKIKNMRTGYHQELKKIRANAKYTPRLPWFAPLHAFLAPFLDKKSDDEASSPQLKPLKRLQIKLPRLKVRPLVREAKPEVKLELEPHQQVLIPNMLLPPVTAVPVPVPVPLSTPTPTTTAAATPAAPLRPAQPASPSDANSTKVERSRFVQSAMGEDEFTFFGLSVAAQLRSMPLANAMILQSRIQYMLSVERRRISGNTTDADFLGLG